MKFTKFLTLLLIGLMTFATPSYALAGKDKAKDNSKIEQIATIDQVYIVDVTPAIVVNPALVFEVPDLVAAPLFDADLNFGFTGLMIEYDRYQSPGCFKINKSFAANHYFISKHRRIRQSDNPLGSNWLPRGSSFIIGMRVT